MNNARSPQRWANDLSVVLRTALGADRFPVNVKEVAMAYSAQRFPEDPIALVRGNDLPGFEGALVPAPPGRKGWGILYNNAIRSRGRINFTLGHEFGHYLLHRLEYPKGFECSAEDMASWESKYGQLEHEANVFAATLLMPLDDFRVQIEARARPNIDELGNCADRYDVSLIAATLRWLQFSERRSMLVVSREGFILWARSSEPALKTGLYYRTRNQPPIEVPSESLAARRSIVEGVTGAADHDAGIWRNEPCSEHVLFSDQYDFVVSVLHFADSAAQREPEEDAEQDTYERMISRNPGQSWLS